MLDPYVMQTTLVLSGHLPMLKRVRYAKEVRATSVCVCGWKKTEANVVQAVATMRHEWQF